MKTPNFACPVNPTELARRALELSQTIVNFGQAALPILSAAALTEPMVYATQLRKALEPRGEFDRLLSEKAVQHNIPTESVVQVPAEVRAKHFLQSPVTELWHLLRFLRENQTLIAQCEGYANGQPPFQVGPVVDANAHLAAFALAGAVVTSINVAVAGELVQIVAGPDEERGQEPPQIHPGQLPAIELALREFPRVDSPEYRKLLLGIEREARSIANGPPKESSVQPVPDSEIMGPNVFRKQGGDWLVRYAGGANFLVPDLVGMPYIHELICRSHKKFQPNELRAITAAERIDRSSRSALGAAQQQTLHGKKTSFGNNEAGEIVSREALEKISIRLVEIDLETEEAKQDGDDSKCSCLASEREKLLAEIDRATVPGGSLKWLQNQAKKDTDAVRKAIKLAIKKISVKDKPLGNHLRNSLQLGSLYQYKPEKAVTWET